MRNRSAFTRLSQLDGDPVGSRLWRGAWVRVAQWEQGVLFRHGRWDTTLGPGRHRRWRGGYTLRTVDLRPWVLLVPTQEVPTADGSTVKVTVAGTARVIDPKAFCSAAQDPVQALYLAVQITLRELLAATTLEELLAGRGNVGDRLLGGLRGADALGLEVLQLQLKDIILSAELKRAQAEVLVARAQGLAALERARGETAALRSLANAARIAADNPALLHLRLLQQLGASSGHTVVIATPPGATLPPTSGGPAE